MRRLEWAAVAGCALVVIACGCGGSGVERFDISGNVTFGGEPVPYGDIEFLPKESNGSDAPAGFAEIENGKYSTANDGQGVSNGSYTVRITAYAQPLPESTGDELAEAAQDPVEPLFVGYSVDAEINSDTMDFDVPADAAGMDSISGVAGGPRPGDP